jgi:hypothetical protein
MRQNLKKKNFNKHFNLSLQDVFGENQHPWGKVSKVIPVAGLTGL